MHSTKSLGWKHAGCDSVNGERRTEFTEVVAS